MNRHYSNLFQGNLYLDTSFLNKVFLKQVTSRSSSFMPKHLNKFKQKPLIPKARNLN
ncbi:hypothetical protein MTT09_07360 [Campylobacter concisus]|uniref:hypothetical protein n=1 Tax=Campylobacter concisus TaxID=199 RepID=UPI003D24A18D